MTDAPVLDSPGTLLGLPLTPLDRRRLENFKANRRGLWSFWIFLALFLLSLCSEIIANDRPIVAALEQRVARGHYQAALFLLVVVTGETVAL